MSARERVYRHLPVWLQNLACSLEGARIQRERYGPAYDRVYDEVAARAAWPDDRARAFRDRRTLDFVREAAARVPFYRERLRSAGMSAGDLATVDAVTRLPILSKAEAVAAGLALHPDATIPPGSIPVHTSGTTGAGFRFHATPDAIREQWAVWWRYRAWHGIRPDEWCGYFAGRSVVPLEQRRPPYWRVNRAGRQILFSGYHMSPATLDAYVDELNRRRPAWLHGYPSLLTLLAEHLADGHRRLEYQVRCVTIGAENLMAHQRRAMADAFGVAPRQHYGLAEAVANVSECEAGRLHVDEDFAFVEFVPVPGQDAMRIVGTNVSNPLTPLVRYDTGDLATLDAEGCSCGRPGRLVRHIDGRREDFVITASGARVGRMDHVFKDLVRVREAQIRQRERGAIDVLVVPGPGFGPRDEQELRDELALRVGGDMRVRITTVERIPRTAAGKLRFVVSEMEDGAIDRARPEAVR